MSKMYKVMLRQPDGWLRSQAEVTIRDGQIVTALQQSEFKKKVLEEKGERSSQAAERRKLKN